MDSWQLRVKELFLSMSRKYKIRDQQKLYFVTFTVVHWIDFFIRNEYRNLFVDSVRYCQENKGLEVYAWCLMPSHVHLIIGGDGTHDLVGIIRDLKSFTSRNIRKLLEDRGAIGESRREWMYWMFQRAGIKNSNNNDFQFWQQHNHPIVLDNNELLEQKMNYIHQNPVQAGFVDRPETWLYSSASDYMNERKGFLDLIFIC